MILDYLEQGGSQENGPERYHIKNIKGLEGKIRSLDFSISVMRDVRQNKEFGFLYKCNNKICNLICDLKDPAASGWQRAYGMARMEAAKPVERFKQISTSTCDVVGCIRAMLLLKTIRKTWINSEMYYFKATKSYGSYEDKTGYNFREGHG